MYRETCEQTDRAVISDPLGSFNRMIQAGPAQVDILAVVVGGEQLQQARKDHVVIVVHVAKPPGKRQTHTQKKSHSLYPLTPLDKKITPFVHYSEYLH